MVLRVQLGHTTCGHNACLAQLWDAEKQQCLDGNKERKKDAENIVGLTYFLVFLMMNCIVGICAHLGAWFTGWPYKLVSLAGTYNFVFWWFGLIFFLTAASWTMGFPAWVGIMIVYTLAAMALSSVYLYLARKRMKEVHALSALGIQLPEKQWQTATNQTDPDEERARQSDQYQYNPYAVETSRSVAEDGAQFRQRKGGDQYFSIYPRPFTNLQRKIFYGIGGSLLFLLFCNACLAYYWEPKKYCVWDHQQQTRLIEFQPKAVAKLTLVMYTWPRLGILLNFDFYTKRLTSGCGSYYSKLLELDKDREEKIYKNYIYLYDIDMTPYQKCYERNVYIGAACYRHFDSVNDFYTRALKPGMRPIPAQANSATIVSPADSRTMLFGRIEPDVRIWVKGDGFTVYSVIITIHIIFLAH
jgi:hypothetical protein